MRFLRRSLIGVFLLCATFALFAVAANTVREAVVERMNDEPRSFPQRERVFAVNVTELVPETITPVLTTFGEVQSRRTLGIRATIGGTVTWTDPALIEGGSVSAGQPLLRVDPRSVQAERDRIAADLQDAQAEVRDAERGLDLAQDELDGATAQAALRTQAETRARDLLDRGVGTTAALETAELAAQSAEASVLTRRQALASAEARLDQARTRLSRAEINLTEAERQVEDTEITAAFDGALTDVTVSPGGRVTANEQIATLLDPDQLEVAFRVSTAQYARLLDGEGDLIAAPVAVQLDVSGVDLVAQGQITREGASVGEGQTGRLLFAQLDAAAGFRPGDFVTVSIDEPELTGVALVPATAVDADRTVLIVTAEDRLELRAVEQLRTQGDDVIIRVGDLAGEEIVVARSPLLGAGIGVRPLREEEEAVEEEPQIDASISLDDDRRAKLVAFVQDGRMPDEVKTRIIAQLEQPEVPLATVERLEGQMGG
ncbi:MAG: HlyD family efflux transporter periplasmic adaptor subunit [Paracoccaceae bacterium]